MSDTGKAIFLSYASEDVEAAQGIAEALRAAGLEVWFDQNELRGGEQWDTTIRRQIRECGLFIPVISQNTQKRREAYFRLEWNLANKRTDLMAAGVAFIVPVVIDETAEYGSAVPESFSDVQWTRLTSGNALADFVSRVQEILADTEVPAPAAVSGRRFGQVTTRSIPARKTMRVPTLMVGVAVVAAGAALILSLRQSDRSNDLSPEGSEITVPDARNVAVLPFANMSEDPEASSFFADGMHEDLLTNLSYLKDLRVVSRTSVMQYRNTTKAVRRIADELGVGTLVEGSVRRVGNRVRVTAQLIDALKDEHLWAQSYDRRIEDIFEIQAELAQAIADALHLVLSPKDVAAFAAKPTASVEAYELFLKEREVAEEMDNIPARVWESISLIERALELDPDFALAWARLGVLHARAHFWNFDRSPARLEQANHAIQRALELAPKDLDVQTSVGIYYQYAFRDFDRAAFYYEQVLAVAPNHATALASMGFARRRQGRWRESTDLLHRVLERDPRNVMVLTELVETYGRFRKFAQAVELMQRVVEIHPNSIEYQGQLHHLLSNREGSFKPSIEWAATFPEPEASDQVNLWFVYWDDAVGARDLARMEDMLKNPPSFFEDSEVRSLHATIARAKGEDERARQLLGENIKELRAALAETPEAHELRNQLTHDLAVLGEAEEAWAEFRRYKAELIALGDAMDGDEWRFLQASLKAWLGPAAEAVVALRDALNYPIAFTSRLEVEHELDLYPLFDTTEFKALLADSEAFAPIAMN